MQKNPFRRSDQIFTEKNAMTKRKKKARQDIQNRSKGHKFKFVIVKSLSGSLPSSGEKAFKIEMHV